MKYLIGSAKELKLGKLLRRILAERLTCVLQIRRQNDSCRLVFISGDLFISPQEDLPSEVIEFDSREVARPFDGESTRFGDQDASSQVAWLLAEWLREGEIRWYRMDDVPATLAGDLVGPFRTDAVATYYETVDSPIRSQLWPTAPFLARAENDRPSLPPALGPQGQTASNRPTWNTLRQPSSTHHNSQIAGYEVPSLGAGGEQTNGLEGDTITGPPSYSSGPELLWQRHFGMYREPFSLTPDPEFLFLSEGHQEALAALKLSLLERRGLTVMTGEVGTGKTTLLYSMLSELEGKVDTAYLYNTTLSFDELLEGALQDLGVAAGWGTRLGMLNALNQFLDQARERGRTVALVVDEAQNLSGSAFEGLRLLLNFETYQSKLLQIILVGQPELGKRLLAPSLRQIADRVAIRCHLRALTEPESHEYLAHRLRLAGAEDAVISPPARRFVVRRAKGVPRRINVICHNGLLFAYGRGEKRVEKNLMKAADRELRMADDPRFRQRRWSWLRQD